MAENKPLPRPSLYGHLKALNLRLNELLPNYIGPSIGYNHPWEKEQNK